MSAFTASRFFVFRDRVFFIFSTPVLRFAISNVVITKYHLSVVHE